jgi:NAD(P)-dependent dehydrogenase (short-subunit alcohol dehydrogenase family)
MDGAYSVSLSALLRLAELAQLENVDQGIRVDVLASDIVTSPTGTAADESSLLPGDLASWVLWLLEQPPGERWQPVQIGNQKQPPA